MTTNRISYIVFIKESDMRCLQSFCYIFCGSKFFPTCRADDYSEFSRNLAPRMDYSCRIATRDNQRSGLGRLP